MPEEVKKARRNARDRNRYATDEEYRKKRLEKSKNHWENLAQDTEKKLEALTNM